MQTLRKRRQWSRRELAERAGISTRTIARIEAGHDAQGMTFAAVAEALGTTITALFKP